MSKLNLLSIEDAEAAARCGWQVAVVVDSDTGRVFAEPHPTQTFSTRCPHVHGLLQGLTKLAAQRPGLERRAVHAMTAFNQQTPFKAKKK